MAEPIYQIFFGTGHADSTGVIVTNSAPRIEDALKHLLSGEQYLSMYGKLLRFTVEEPDKHGCIILKVFYEEFDEEEVTEWEMRPVIAFI